MLNHTTVESLIVSINCHFVSKRVNIKNERGTGTPLQQIDAALPPTQRRQGALTPAHRRSPSPARFVFVCFRLFCASERRHRPKTRTRRVSCPSRASDPGFRAVPSAELTRSIVSGPPPPSRLLPVALCGTEVASPRLRRAELRRCRWKPDRAAH